MVPRHCASDIRIASLRNSEDVEQLFPTSERPFQALVDNGINPNLLRIISRGGTALDAIGGDGPLAETRELTRQLLPARDAGSDWPRRSALKESVTLDIGSYKAFEPHVGSGSTNSWISTSRSTGGTY